jgi:predicted MFS family arabinose efflux permease
MRFKGLDLGLPTLMTMSMACDLTTFVIPLIVDTLVTSHHIPDARVGFIITAQELATAFLAFAMVSRIGKLDPRATITLGLLLVAFGNGLTAFAYQAPLVLAARIAAGLGEALVNVVVGVLMARRADPDNGFAMITIGITTGAVIVFVAAPLAAPSLGKDGVFWILTALPLLALFLVGGLPRVMARGEAREAGPAAAGPAAQPSVLTWPAILLLLGLVGFGVAGNAIFTFIERVADGIGVSYAAFNAMLLWCTVATAAGPVFARLVGLRFGRMPMIALSFLGVAISGPLTGSPDSPAMLRAGLLIGGFCIMIATPYYSGLMVTADPTGRLITLSRGVLTIGMALTPSIASLMLMAGGGFPAMGVLSAVIGVASLGAVFVAERGLTGGRAPGRTGVAPQVISGAIPGEIGGRHP